MLKKLSIVLGAVALVAVGYTAVDIVAPDQTAMVPLVGSAYAYHGKTKHWARHTTPGGTAKCIKVTGFTSSSSCVDHLGGHPPRSSHEHIYHSKANCLSTTSPVDNCDQHFFPS